MACEHPPTLFVGDPFCIVNVSGSQAGAAYRYGLVSQPLAFLYTLSPQPVSLRASFGVSSLFPFLYPSFVPFSSSLLCLLPQPFLLRRHFTHTQKKTIPTIAKDGSQEERLVLFHPCEYNLLMSSSYLFCRLDPWPPSGLPLDHPSTYCNSETKPCLCAGPSYSIGR